MSNKIDCGIVTFHRAHNYGAVLQAYALQRTIDKLGHNAGFIDLQHRNLEVGYSLHPSIKSITSIRKLLSYFKRWYEFLRDSKRKTNRYLAFESFIDNNMRMIDVSKINCINNLVLGSDQIWNAGYTEGVYPLYYGKVEGLSCDNTISYAASMGTSNLLEEELVQFNKYIIALKAVGVREKSLMDYIKDVVEIDSTLNLDPTLLMTSEEWSKLAGHSLDKESRPYLLVYEVHSHKGTNDLVKEIASKHNLEIKVLAPKTDHRIDKSIISDARPEDFLQLFREASFVVTTSFHGTVFSIINEKPFVTMEFGNDIDIRSKGLLHMLGLEGRLSESYNIASEEIDYKTISSKLQMYREESIEYLKKNLIKERT
ncbi:polysaccharide pyruvyl transferase family protein [Vibrio fluvialis]|nr:polysaccharide pyruvyl transferase family protein [Vibrio fluvialis]